MLCVTYHIFLFTAKKITDKNTALIAVKKNGDALQYVSDRLRDDVELQKLANN